MSLCDSENRGTGTGEASVWSSGYDLPLAVLRRLRGITPSHATAEMPLCQNVIFIIVVVVIIITGTGEASVICMRSASGHSHASATAEIPFCQKISGGGGGSSSIIIFFFFFFFLFFFFIIIIIIESECRWPHAARPAPTTEQCRAKCRARAQCHGIL